VPRAIRCSPSSRWSSTRRAESALALLALFALASAAPSASAHLTHPELGAERSIELDLARSPIRVRYRVAFAAAAADRIRAEANRNGDDGVSVEEGNAALDARTASLLASLSVCTGPTLLTVSCRSFGAGDVEHVEAEGWSPPPDGHLQLTWTFRMKHDAGDLGAVRLEDRDATAAVAESDVVIIPPPGVTLSRAGDGASTSGPSLRFAWNERRRPPGPRVIVAEWAAAAPAGVRRLALVLTLIATLALLWLWTRRAGAAKLR
jgi:hypothetical protein